MKVSVARYAEAVAATGASGEAEMFERDAVEYLLMAGVQTTLYPV